MTPIAALSTRFLATDPRADDGLREISIAAEAVAINRRVSGVKMRLSVPMAHFRGVALCVLENARGFLFRVALVHPDPELDVILAESEREEEIGRVWRDWAQTLRLPLIARSTTGETMVERRYGEVQARAVQPRRRGWPLKRRRSMISARRTSGPKGRVMAVHGGEREIICYE